MGSLVIAWTIRVAVLIFFATLIIWVLQPSQGIAHLIFIAFNGVAVFKDGWMRVGGIAAPGLILVGAIMRLKAVQPSAIERA